MVNLRSYLHVSWSSVLAEATLPCRALSSELFMKFRCRSRDKRLRTKPENQLFFQILVDLISKRRIYRAQIQLADLCSFPVLKSFLGHLNQAPTVLRFRSRFTKLKSLSGGSSFVFHSHQPCGASLVAFQQTQLPKPSLQAQRGISFT